MLGTVPRQRRRGLPGAVRHGLHLRRSVRPGVAAGRRPARPSGGSPTRRPAGRQLVVVGAPIRSATACSTAPWRSRTARSWASCPSSSCPTTRSSTRADGSARPSARSRPRSTGRPATCRSGSICCSRQGADEARRAGRPRRRRRDLRGPLGARCPPAPSRRWPGRRCCVNLSASNETIGKSRYRTDLVVGQSGRCVSAYAMAGCGPSESTTDVVFGGHCLIAENGVRWPSRPGSATASRSAATRTRSPGTSTSPAADRSPRHDQLRRQPLVVRPFRRVPFALAPAMDGLHREVPGTPFVPRRAPSCTAAAPRSSASSAPDWPSGSSSSLRARR